MFVDIGMLLWQGSLFWVGEGMYMCTLVYMQKQQKNYLYIYFHI